MGGIPYPESEVEVDDGEEDWAFINLNPWLLAHPRHILNTMTNIQKMTSQSAFITTSHRRSRSSLRIAICLCLSFSDTRSPRSSLKSLSSRPSLASLAANLGANLTAGVRHLGTLSRRVSVTGTPSRGSRSTSRENRPIQEGGTSPPLPLIPSRVQSIRNRSASFVELVEMHEDGDDDVDIHSVGDSPVHSGVGEDEEDITMALTSTSTTQRDHGLSIQDEDELRLSSPSHSSNSSLFSNPNSLVHTPSSNSHSPPTRIIGVPRGIEFGSSGRESSGAASSSKPSGGRSSGEGRRPLSMLSASRHAGVGSEGTFGRPGELARFVGRERELARDRGGHPSLYPLIWCTDLSLPFPAWTC